MPGFISTASGRELIRIGDEAIAAEDDAKLRAYSLRTMSSADPVAS